MGSGEKTLFWEDCWLVDGVKLRDLFPRLFRLDSNKNCLIADRFFLRENEMVWNWQWRRVMYSWEEELLSDLTNVLNRYSFELNKADF